MRCDLHVHTLCSGWVNLPLLRHLGRECYSTPEEIYRTARRRGMDLVTISDHDTIEGALAIAGLPGTFVSEEVSCEVPGGRVLHLGVFDIAERQHERISRLRRDPEALFAYLAEERIPFCVNHIFSPLTGRREVGDFHLALGHVPLVETLNGMMPRSTNEFARRVGLELGLGAVGGSDAHAIGSVARAYTVVPRARNREEFLAGLRAGLTVPAGSSGRRARLAGDIATVLIGALAENAGRISDGPRAAARFAATLALVPLLTVIPLIAVVNFAREQVKGRAFHQLYRSSLPRAERAESPVPPPYDATLPDGRVELGA